MKRRIMMAAMLCLAIVLAGSAAPASGTDLSVCITDEPDSLDPNRTTALDSMTYVLHMFENLMRYEQTDENAAPDGSDNVKLLIPACGQAESYEVSDDGLVYTFHLRDDIFWSDGERVVADDWVYSWKRLVDPANAFDWGYILDGVVENASAIREGNAGIDSLGVAAPDDLTLVVTLEEKCPYFLDLCSFSALVPLRRDVVEEYGSEWTSPGHLVSNGKYVLDEWVHDNSIHMTLNDRYYEKVDGPDGITWNLNGSGTSQLAAFEAGAYDFCRNVPEDEFSDLSDRGLAHAVSQIGTYYLFLQTRTISDWRVRAAIALCIDRENIVENVTQGEEIPAAGVVAAGITTYDGGQWTEYVGDPMYEAVQAICPDADTETYAGRCELAEQLLEAAVADGYDPSVTIAYEYNTSELNRAIAEAVQDDVSSVLGLKLSLNNSEWQTYDRDLAEGDFGIARLGFVAAVDDPTSQLVLFTRDNSFNYGKWTGDACDAYSGLVQQAGELPKGEERDALLAEAERSLFAEDAWSVCPIYFYTQKYCIDPDLKGVGWTPHGHFMFDQAVENG